MGLFGVSGVLFSQEASKISIDIRLDVESAEEAMKARRKDNNKAEFVEWFLVPCARCRLSRLALSQLPSTLPIRCHTPVTPARMV